MTSKKGTSSARTAPKRMAILTGGGDCPGLNAVIRAAAKTAQNDYGVEVIGVGDSYWGLLTEDFRILRNRDVSGILGQGGTILGTSRVDPFAEAHRQGKLPSPREDWDVVKRILRRHKIDGLVAVGGDGTLRVAARAHAAGIPIVGVPKTIDNDIGETDLTFGFNSAVSIVMNALDVLHTTAMSHHRVMVVEVMGRTVGWLALEAGVAGGGDVLLLPEIPYREKAVFERVLERSRTGKRFSIVVVAEGARPRGGGVVHSGETDGAGRNVLGGIGRALAERIGEATGLSARVTTLGHLQRGGPPTAFDRVLASQFGHFAVNLLLAGESGQMAALKGSRIKAVSMDKATRRIKKVPRNHPLIAVARSVGTCFGDE
ncbi:MAG TPA: ATP-dependent 6-phosphofructokinase [Sumerlaeia bacterium]|nr:ATP-dependent 6-phosphofructokinase [Sumerlaeia bacterium]